RIRVEQDNPQLAAIAGVDEPGRVDHRDAVLRGKPGAWLDVAGVAVGNRDREAGADDHALARRQLDAVARCEIETCVAAVCAPRHDGVLAQAQDWQLDHAPPTRYGAKRRMSRRGNLATTSTPSPVSSRSSMGAPRAYSSLSFAPSL